MALAADDTSSDGRSAGHRRLLAAQWIAERAAAAIATGWMCALIILVARNNPGLLVDPYGALVKDLSLIASAYTVWILADKRQASAAR